MTKKEIKQLTNQFIELLDKRLAKFFKSKSFITSKKMDVKLDVILNFMSEIKADMMVTKRMLFFLTKNKLSHEELQEFAKISKTIEKEAGQN